MFILFSEPRNLRNIIYTTGNISILAYIRVIIDNFQSTHPVWTVVPGNLLEAPLHGLVLEQRHAPDQVTHQDEVSPPLHVEGDDVVEVGALQVECLVLCPLPLSDGAVDGGQQLTIGTLAGVGGALYLLLSNLATL